MRRDRTRARRVAPAAGAALEALETRRLLTNSAWAYPGADGHMLYQPLPLGDHIEDFSTAGYMGGTVPIPTVAVLSDPRATVAAPSGGDDTAIIQAAIDFVSTLPMDPRGFRGAVSLGPGTYQIDGVLNINASGVVLRGSGVQQTLLYATTNTSTAERTIINVNGSNSQSTSNTRNIVDKYVPVGAISFTVNDASGFAVGDTVIIHRPSTQQWINDIGMNQLAMPWTPGSKDINMDRTITHIDGNVITIDAPITQALDLKYTDATEGTNTIYKYTASGRLSNVGIEDIGGISQFDPTVTDPTDGPIDENHPWTFINIDGAINSWARNIESQFFGYSCVYVTNSKYVTVQDSECIDPVSQITGGRRYSFNIDGSQMVLFRNCYTREGRHDYVEGSTVTGPNVFVDDRADNTHDDIGPHHRYSTAALWDNIKGGKIDIQNRGNFGTGHGWAGANQVIWNSAGTFIVQQPPAANNWLIGSVGTINNGTVYVGPHDPGIYDSSGPSPTGANVTPRSLYYQQLGERMAYENFVLRESRLGDSDNYTNDGAADNVNVDATWKSSIQTATGKTGVGFDTVANNQLVPFTFNFPLDPGTYVVGASLSLGVKSAGNSTAGDGIYFENASRSYSWADLGVAAPTTTAGAVVIDLSAKLLAALQDGKLNVAIAGNTAVDWATLNLQTASTTQPSTTTLTASADAYVDSASPTSNFGTATTVATKLDPATTKESYLKFDLSSFSGTITRATIRLVPTSVGYAPDTRGSGIAAMFNQLSFVSDDTWSETGINWNNKPASDAAFSEFISKAGAPENIDVTSLVNAALAGDRKLSLRLLSITQSTAGQISYGSRENADVTLRPQLIIQSFANAISPVADAYVRSGVNANSSFGTTTDLAVKKDTSGTSDNNRDAYLKFDLTGVATTPAGATLRMMPVSVGANAPAAADFVSTDSWTETGITWNNRPANTSSAGSWQVSQATPGKLDLTSLVGSTIAGDKLLSLHVGSNTTSSGVNDYGSRENADPGARPMLILKNLGPQITAISNVSGQVNAPTSPMWFGIWDAETAPSALSVTATSSNTTLLPNANITLGGSGMDRTFALTPAADQGGTTTITITVTDAQGQTASTSFTYAVNNSIAVNGDRDAAGEADTFRIVRNGSLVDVYRNGVLALEQSFTAPQQILINGLAGNDTILADYSGGDPIPAAGVSIDGGADSDVITVAGTSGADAFSLAPGSAGFASQTFSYSNAEQIVVNTNGGADTIAAGGNSSVSAGALAVNVTGPAGSSLAMAASSTLPDFTDVNVASGATFNLNGQNQTIDALTGSGTVNNNGVAAATLAVGAQNSSFAFAGALANGTSALALTKNGTGKLTLTGANSYTGLSTINSGVIEAGTSASFVGLSGQVRFNGGTLHVTGNSTAANVASKFTTSYTGATSSSTATFDIDANATLIIGGTVASMQTNGGGAHGGTFTKTGAGTLDILSNNGQLDDPFKLNAGTVILESATGLGGADNSSNHVDMKNGTTLVLKQDATTNFLTPISIVDPGATVNVTLDRKTAGAGQAFALNSLSSVGAFMLNLNAGANVNGGIAGLTLGAATLGGNGTFIVNNGAAATTLLTITGAVTGAFALTKTGSGTLLLSGVNSYTGATSVSGGALRVDGSIASSSGVSVASGATFAAGATQTLTSLTIASGGSAMVAAGANKVLTVDALSISGSGVIDLADNDLIIDYSGASPVAAVRGWLTSGYAGGAWTGAGIRSSTAATVAATNGSPLTAVGYAEAGELFATFPATFAGQSVDATSLLLRYTAAGDANLDGAADTVDFNTLAANFGTSGRDWAHGDWNYDGIVDTLDFNALAGNFGATVASVSPLAAVVQPARATPTNLFSEQHVSTVGRVLDLINTGGDSLTSAAAVIQLTEHTNGVSPQLISEGA